MSKHRSKLALIALFMASGCATQAPPLQPSGREGIKEKWAQTDGVQYRCAGNRSFVASFAPDGRRAAIKLGEKVYEVPQADSSSGIHYKSDGIDYIGKGRDAQLLKSPGGAYTECRVVN